MARTASSRRALRNKRGSRLSLGKLPPEVMERYLFGMTGARSARVVVEPALGLDFGVVSLGDGKDRYLIVSSDPITGVSERAGWYAVNVSANDVATSGRRPEFLQSVILLPEDANEEDVRELSSDIHQTAKALGIAVVGGHTELTPGLDRPIVATTAFAIADSYVTAGGASEGDTLMMTKSAGVEGTAILGADPRFSRSFDRATRAGAAKQLTRLSVVEEAVAAYETGAVHAMHDCTEGGVMGAIYEMAKASGLGLEVDEARIPVSPDTGTICRKLGVDPLKLISSGTLLVAVRKGSEGDVRRAVEGSGSEATAVGRFTAGKVLMRQGGRLLEIRGPPKDEIWRLHEAASRRAPSER